MATGFPIDGPVKNPVADARRMIYATSGGIEGVSRATDLVVRPLDVPGAGFQVSPGSGLILSRYVDGETYQAGLSAAETHPITPTGSAPAGGRTDLVALLVKDPWAVNSAWVKPAEPKISDCFVIHVFENVPAEAQKVSDIPGVQAKFLTALPLARFTLPASTGTLTQSMITDLREMTTLKATRQPDLVMPPAFSLTGTTEVQFTTAVQHVRIPSWATHIRTMVRILGVMNYGGPSSVEFRLKLGTDVFSPVSGHTTETSSGMYERTDKTIPMVVPIPAEMRGTTQPLIILAKRNTGTVTTTPGRTSVEFDTWLEESI